MNHAFLIQAHKFPELLYQIIDKLDAINHYFFIHIDKRSKEMLSSSYIEKISNKSNCFIYSEYAVNWGSEKQFWTTLYLIKKALQYKIAFTYYHLLSGQDYPVKSNKEIDNYFNLNCGNSYMGIINSSDMDKRYMVYHFDRIINSRGNFINRIFRKICEYIVNIQILIYKKGISIRPTLNKQLYKGSSWWSLHHELIVYIENYINKHPQFLKRFNYTTCCDEIFFHVIIMNSQYANTIINDSLRFVDWSDISRGYPCVLDETDFNQIINSNCLFCRKIEPYKSKQLLDKIDSII